MTCFRFTTRMYYGYVEEGMPTTLKDWHGNYHEGEVIKIESAGMGENNVPLIDVTIETKTQFPIGQTLSFSIETANVKEKKERKQPPTSFSTFSKVGKTEEPWMPAEIAAKILEELYAEYPNIPVFLDRAKQLREGKW